MVEVLQYVKYNDQSWQSVTYW